jgi:hypothetical protein
MMSVMMMMMMMMMIKIKISCPGNHMRSQLDHSS